MNNELDKIINDFDYGQDNEYSIEYTESTKPSMPIVK